MTNQLKASQQKLLNNIEINQNNTIQQNLQKMAQRYNLINNVQNQTERVANL